MGDLNWEELLSHSELGAVGEILRAMNPWRKRNCKRMGGRGPEDQSPPAGCAAPRPRPTPDGRVGAAAIVPKAAYADFA